MANKVQIRRGNFANLPVLSNGEPGLAEDVGKVYIGNGGSNLGVQMAPGTTDYTVYVATTALGGLSQATQGATGLLLASGTTSATTANKLVDSIAAFTAALVNKTVYNATTDTWAKVTAVDSPTTLSLSADIFLTAQSYKVASAIDNIPEAFSTADSGYRANVTVRISPGVFSNDITLIGKTAGDNKTLTLQGSTTGATTISRTVTVRQKITLANISFTNWIKAYFGADITWNTCVTSGASKLYHYDGNANTFNSSTVVFGNDPGSYTAVSSTVTKGYTMYVASATLGGNDAVADGLAIKTGTNTSVTASALVDAAASFDSSLVGKTVYNSTDDAWAKVIAYVSATQLTLSADIFTATGKAYVVANAFSTVQRVIDAIPGSVNCNTTIKLSNEIFREAVNIWGKNFTGAYSITLTGTLVSSLTGTASSGANPVGNGSAGYGTLTDTTKAWTVNAYVNTFVEITGGTGSGQIRVIHANTATVLTITGRWDTVPDATSTYRVFTLGTRVTGANAGAETTRVRDFCIKVDNGQKGLVVQRMKIDYAGVSNLAFNAPLLVLNGSSCDVNTAHLSGGNYWNILATTSSSCSFLACAFTAAVIGDVEVESNSYCSLIKRCRLTGSAYMSISANIAGIIYPIYETYVGQVTGSGRGLWIGVQGTAILDAYAEIDSCSGSNIFIETKGMLFINSLYGARTTVVSKNAGAWGVQCLTGGTGHFTSGITYTANTSGTYTPTTQLAGGND
ncbi:MAG: hypothetical protein HY889_08175 [Deltaproteobacteria bacterium]|nr:hypothetical protein [Deltaproteobacteria bacterium]